MRLFALSMLIFSIGCGTPEPENNGEAPDTSLPDVEVPSTDLLAPPKDVPKPDCVPTKTCADYPNQCGSALSDGCVGTLDCSSACLPPNVCLADETCGEPSQCVPNCTAAECGSDGCGGTCGDCSDGAECVDGACITECTPSCDGAVCGDDGCGGSCGSCATDENCTEGQCVSDCIPDCEGKTCGDNGCGDICGVCEPDFDCVAGACESAGSGMLVLNEVLFDPAPGLDGDANCDGVREGSEDEFVEIVNDSATTIDLTGATLSDAVSVRHTFAEGSILGPKGVMVVFGGGSPTFDGSGQGAWCGAIPQSVYVVTASTGQLGLNNDGDTITLALADTSEVFTVTIDGALTGNNQSVARAPELTGDWAEHSTVNDAIGPQSPTTRTDGSSF